MNPASERRLLDMLDEALDWPRNQREIRLSAIAATEPETATRLRRLLEAEDAASRRLPTDPGHAARGSHSGPPPPERVGPYRLVSLLGEGGMGSVWCGERDDGLFEQTVAIKLVRPGPYAASLAAQFDSERRLLARLRHPAIAQLFDGGTDPEGRAFFVMEHVEGVPLTDHVAGRGPDAWVSLLETVCAAVGTAHRSLVVHADIKPANILVDREGRVKLLDFGIARSLTDDTVADGAGLTLPYASPERRAGEAAVPADDVYAIGATMWELAAGRPPDTAPPRALSPAEAPPELAAVVAKATAAARDDRHGTAAELAEDLRRWRERLPVGALPRSRRRSFRLLLRRRPFASAATAAAAVGLVLAFVAVSTLWLRAEAERREADLRFEDARGMARYMLFELFPDLTDVPGTLPFRRKLAERARTYLGNLSAAPRAPPDVRAEAAIGLMQIAGVDGLFTAGELGDRAEAERSLAQARAILGAGPDASADDPRLVYARGRLALFDGLLRFERNGAGAEAAPMFRKAVDALVRARRLLPADPEIATDLWQARLFLADALGSTGDRPAEVEVVRQAIADHDAAEALFAKSATTPLLVARSLKLIGEAQAGGGSQVLAETAFRRAEAVLLDEEKARPGRTRTLMELLDIRRNLAEGVAAQGRTAEALAVLDGALADAARRLVADRDHEGLRRTESLLQSRRAELLAALGRMREAQAAAEAGLASRAERHRLSPDDAVAWREFLAGLRSAGLAAKENADARLGCIRLAEARRGYDAFLGRFPDAQAFVVVEATRLDDELKGCRPTP